MKKFLLGIGLALALQAGFTGTAEARSSFGLSLSSGSVYGSPGYYAPAPVYYQPAPVYYQPAPVYYAPQPAYYPAYYGPTYYGPAYSSNFSLFYGNGGRRYGGYHGGHGHGGRWH